MKQCDYIVIQAPMITDMRLSGNRLVVYALIHGFCKDGEHEFKGSISYICEWTNLTRNTVIATLKSLVDDGLLVKREYTSNGVKFCAYCIGSAKIALPVQLTSQKAEETDMGGSAKIALNNTNTNNNNNNNKKLNNKLFSPKVNFDAILKSWNDNNGNAWGKVALLTEKRKRAIVTLLDNHKISDTQLCRLFAALPYSDDWLFNPTGQHKTWKPTFDWWIANTSSWFTRALEAGVHTNNPQAFKDIMEGNAVSAYHPQQSPSLVWDENNKVYIYIGFFDGRFIPDGYNDDNRPDSARILLNNARGIIQWDAEKKEWQHIG